MSVGCVWLMPLTYEALGALCLGLAELWSLPPARCEAGMLQGGQGQVRRGPYQWVDVVCCSPEAAAWCFNTRGSILVKMWWAEPRYGFKSLYFFVFPVYFGILDVPVHILMTVDLNVKRHFGMSLRRRSLPILSLGRALRKRGTWDDRKEKCMLALCAGSTHRASAGESSCQQQIAGEQDSSNSWTVLNSAFWGVFLYHAQLL